MMKIEVFGDEVIRNWRPIDSELWRDKMKGLTRMCLGNGYPEEAMQHNIRIVMKRWKDVNMPTLLRIGWKAAADAMEMPDLYNPDGKDKPTQVGEVNKMECFGVYSIKCKTVNKNTSKRR
ncbi:unnamed protein product [Protopolystoma xenopodis]|uniref:Uncharacterized protein n=1 Tax=Protopolystoma xenopodis TaxID=117903 RepID=A0A448XT65_9PLAT|nr:unnamed protein product [Protopolystoma xenopodis]